jgi:CheY-like chemotaxis protein
MSMGNALLVSDDSTHIHQLSRALGEVSIRPDICREVPEALRLLHTRKFDAIIVDSQLGLHSASVLEEVRSTASNRTAVTFAIGGSDMDSNMRRLSSFVFDGPVSSDSVRRTLRAAYGLVLRERRRYFRCPVSIPVLLLRQAQPEVHCDSVNISEGGMALSTSVSPNPGEKIRVQFTLPDHKAPFLTESDVCWNKPGQLGIRFLDLSREHKSVLQTWLSQKLEDTLPESVAGKFRKTDD